MALSEPHAVDEREIGLIGWYAATGEDVLARLLSDRQGLSTDEAARRLAEYGPNRLTRQQGPSAWAVLARQFASPLIYALLISAVVAFAFGDLADGAVVLGVVVLNALIGFVQEYRAVERSRHSPSWCRNRQRCCGTSAGRSWMRPTSFPGTSCRSRQGLGSWPT